MEIFIGWILGIISSWVIAKIFAKQSSSELESKLTKQTTKLNSATSFINFERMIRSGKWQREDIENDEVWVCESNNLFQFKRSEDREPFREKWTSVFPDQNGSRFHINLMINGIVVRSLPFVSGDGGRYTLPLPDLELMNEEQVFIWYRDDIDVLIAEIIGNYYRYNSIEQVAKFTKVELVRGRKQNA
ncbi:hypothetical protein AN944_02429 [Shewanella sp. P1-14-1]|uniref:hypothetical protein n=1 Tax=Shewanella sp. P1-14-1 TaxID=1723761 RepID=UPI0006D65ED5|nr:hypothetical protein [Shewanella sp. P1-14-1]KPZ70357.1 hypothetical protein AN944_02429 [Shewanella sp. P1-14-1]